MRSARKPAGVWNTAGDAIEDRDRQSEFGIAHAIVGAHPQEHRRQHQEIEVRQEMRRAHAAMMRSSVARSDGAAIIGESVVIASF